MPRLDNASGCEQTTLCRGCFSFRTCRGPALGAEVFVEIAGWQHEEKTLTSWGGLSASPAVEQRSIKRIVLVRGGVTFG